MKRAIALLLLAAALLSPHREARAQLAAPQYVYCIALSQVQCNTSSNPGNGSQGDDAWLAFGKFNLDIAALQPQAPQFGLAYANGPNYGSLLPGSTGTWCMHWSSLGGAPTLVTCPGVGGGVINSLQITPDALDSGGTTCTSSACVFTFALINQSAGLIFAGPATGSPAAPTFRALASTDIPNNAANTSGNAATATAIAGTGSTAANRVYASPNGSSGALSTRALVGADLPNPGASSLGGVQSAAAVSHQWVNSISTAGVPALSQPSFADISSTATAAQLPAALSSSTSVNGTAIAASAGTAGGSTGAFTTGDCVKVGATSPLEYADAGSACGSGGGGSGNVSLIAKGITFLGQPAIAGSACATATTVAAPSGVYIFTSDEVDASFNGSVTGVTGYLPGAMLTVLANTVPNGVALQVCNNTGSSITPGPVSVNWHVYRDPGPLVSFVQAVTPWGGGASPQASGSFTPVTYGSSDVLIGHASGTPHATISVSGSSGSSSVLSQTSDGTNQFAAAVNTTFSNVSQTATWTQSGATALFGRAWEYTHASSVTSTTFVVSSPGTSTGALVGTSVTVPNGGVLFCSVTNTTGGGFSLYNGTSRGFSGTTYATEELTNTTGASTSMQCAFTATVGTDSFDFEQWVLSP